MSEEIAIIMNGLEIRAKSESDIWLSQKEIAQLYGTSVQNVGQHIKAIKSELAEWEGLEVVIKKSFITTQHGALDSKMQTNEVELYGFEIICQVGYRVNSVAGIKFRQYATQAIREKLERDKALSRKKDEVIKLQNDKLVKAIVEISTLRNVNRWLIPMMPMQSQYGQYSKVNGLRRNQLVRAHYKSKKGRLVPHVPDRTIDLFAANDYSPININDIR